MYLLNINKYLNKDIYLNLNSKYSIMNIKGLYGQVQYKMPSFYFHKLSKGCINLLFLDKYKFVSFIKHVFLLYKRLSFIFSVRLRIKGLGYRIRKVSKFLYYFFFNYTNMYYFYLPNNVLLKWYKKRIVLVSNNFFILKLLFSNMLMLRNIGPYRLRGLRYPRQIIFIKKGIKKS